MSALDQRAPASSRSLSGPPLGCAAGVALAAAIEFLVRHIAPEAPAILGLGLAGLAGLAVIALAFTLEDEALPNLTRAVLAGMGLIVLGALADPEARLRLFSFASAAFGVGLTVCLARTARRRPRVSLGMAALFAAALAGLSAYAAVLVLASRDLMTADFMTYRGIAIMVARLADAGNWPLLMSAAVESITQNCSWAPALAPGVMLALTAPTSRALYTFALLALYAAPALLALAILARDLARRGGLRLSPSPQPCPKGGGGANGRQSPSPFGGRWREAPDEGALALGVAAVFVAYPAAMAVAARGMPDVGGLVLTVCALRLAERLARLLALPKGRDARVAPMTRRVALALPLTMFAMFAFRRWYAFAAAGIAIVLAIEIASIALGKGARFPWKDAVAAAALGLLTLLALMSPVIVDWLPNLSAHDYASAYAAYRKPLAVFWREFGDWVGLIPALAALAGAAFLWARSRDRRLLRLTLGGTGVAAALFLRIQTPYIHHLDLIAPAIVAPIAASLMLVFARAPRAALVGLKILLRCIQPAPSSQATRAMVLQRCIGYRF